MPLSGLAIVVANESLEMQGFQQLIISLTTTSLRLHFFFKFDSRANTVVSRVQSST